MLYYNIMLFFQVAIKQKKGPNSRRTTSLSYHLQYEDGTTYPVCKAMFCATFGIPIRTIGSWLSHAGRTSEQPCTPKLPKTGELTLHCVTFDILNIYD